MHLIDPATGEYNRHLLAPGLSLVKGWQRMQGVLFRPGDRRFEGKAAEAAVQAALADPSCLMVNRNAGAGTRVLIDRLVAGARPPGYANQPRSHNAVAAAIAQARADWGVAIEPVARCMGSGSCRSPPSTTISCWWRAGAASPRSRHFSPRCAIAAQRTGSRRWVCNRPMTRISFAFVLLLLVGPAQAQLRGHGGPVRASAISADGKTLVSGSFDSSAIRWSLTRNSAEQVLRFHESAVDAVALAPDGRIITGGEDGKIAVWQPGSPAPERVLEVMLGRW